MLKWFQTASFNSPASMTLKYNVDHVDSRPHQGPAPLFCLTKLRYSAEINYPFCASGLLQMEMFCLLSKSVSNAAVLESVMLDA